jgi:hypothetical protein
MSKATNAYEPANDGGFNANGKDLGQGTIASVRGKLTGSDSYEPGGYSLDFSGWFRGNNGLISVRFDGLQGKYCPQYDYANKKVKVIDTTSGNEVAAATILSAVVFRYKAEGYL